MGDDNFRDALPDPDPEQTLEWQEAIRAGKRCFGPRKGTPIVDADNWGG